MRATSRVACRTVLLDNSVTEAKMVPMQRREADMMEEKVTNWGTLFILSIETSLMRNAITGFTWT